MRTGSGCCSIAPCRNDMLRRLPERLHMSADREKGYISSSQWRKGEGVAPEGQLATS